jgi:hypothetical protein
MADNLIHVIHIDSNHNEYTEVPEYNEFCILSIFINNPLCHLILWTNNPLKNEKLLKIVDNHVIPKNWLDEAKLIGIKNIAHLSDYIRYNILDIYGGAYFDTDILVTRDIQSLFSHDFVAAYQSARQICNGFIISRSCSKIIEYVLDSYHSDYRSDKWTYNSMDKLYEAIEKYNSELDILLLTYKNGIHYPSFRDMKPFYSVNLPDCYYCYGHHLWASSPNGKKLRNHIEGLISGNIEPQDIYIDRIVGSILSCTNFYD